jgi:hypothetical protein
MVSPPTFWPHGCIKPAADVHEAGRTSVTSPYFIQWRKTSKRWELAGGPDQRAAISLSADAKLGPLCHPQAPNNSDVET